MLAGVKSREALASILEKLTKTVPQIEAVSIVSIEGLPIASVLPKEVDEMRIAAVTAAMLSMGENASTELRKGTLSEIMVQGTSGYVITMASGNSAVLTASATKEVEIGYIYHFMKRYAKDIEASL